MLDLLIAKFSDGHFVAGILVAIGCAATILTLAMPLLQTDNLGRRMKAVSTERERIRQRERERLAVSQNRAALRVSPKRLFKQVVDRLNLASWLGTERAKAQLAMAGYRGAGAEYTFLFFRLVTPIVLFLASILYVFVIIQWDKPFLIKFGVAIAAIYVGIKVPDRQAQEIDGARLPKYA
jgi:tight adherence protein C